jgi:protease I
MKPLDGYRIAAIVADGFEEVELFEPLSAIRAAGGQVCIISPSHDHVHAMTRLERGKVIDVELPLAQAHPQDFDGLLLPGGAPSADQLRSDPMVLTFLWEFHGHNKTIGALGHAAWILISAGIIKGRLLASQNSIRDDVENAGGHGQNVDVVVDSNLITGRRPGDWATFNREFVKLLARQPRRVTRATVKSA